MAAVPRKNSREQAESASGTNKKHEWSGPTRNTGHFLSNFLKGNSYGTRLLVAFSTQKYRSTRGL
jgi:hypothetical protein